MNEPLATAGRRDYYGLLEEDVADFDQAGGQELLPDRILVAGRGVLDAEHWADGNDRQGTDLAGLDRLT